MNDDNQMTAVFVPTLTDNPTKLNLPIYKLFEQQVLRTPDHIAVVCEHIQLTYRELNEYANQVANHMYTINVESGNFVPVVMYKGINMLISLLAIMKVGAAYVPVDPDWPVERIRYVINDVNGPCCLIDKEQSELKFVKEEVFIVDYNTLLANSNVEPITFVSDTSQNSQLIMEKPMYAIYTSGSTGKPKGAIVPHRGILNRFKWMTETVGVQAAHTTLVLSNPTFDSSTWQYLWPLIHGGKTVIPSAKLEKTAYNILELIRINELTLVNFVPSLFDLITEQLILDESTRACMASVKFVWVGGEKLSPKTVTLFQSMFPNIRISNHYGPTEASIACLYYPIEAIPEGDIPLGKPINNVKVVLINEKKELVQSHEIGEICVGGVGVGLGYLNDTKKTEKHFIPNPFPELDCDVLYKTGDLGRYLSDGSIAFLGRSDFQIKIRGFRIELNEIELALTSYPGIRQAVILTKTDKRGDPFLVAYYCSDKQKLTSQEIREYLLQSLPDYMVPLYYMHIENMPLLTNGKINVQDLLSMNVESSGLILDELQTDTERSLASIWESLFGGAPIGRNSHFFKLGGQSLKAARCAMLINTTFGVRLTIGDLFNFPILEQLALRIDSLSNKDKEGYTSIVKAEDRLYYPVTSAQNRLYILNRSTVSQTSTSYNIPGFIIIEGVLNEQQLEKSLEQLVLRHESLRTSYHWNNDGPIQVIHPAVEIKLERISLRNRTPQEAAKAFVRPFDLMSAPLLRAGIANMDVNTHLFFFDVHHIAVDAISMSILLQELFMLYHGDQLDALPIRYRDYAVWQDNNKSSWLEHEAYWLEQFKDRGQAVSLPIDFPRPAEQNDESDRVKLDLSVDQNARLEHWCIENGTTKYMVLLAVFSILQMKYTKQEDIVIGTPVAGRDHPELEGLVGMFVKTLAIRTSPSGNISFKEFLQYIKDKVLNALEHQDYPFEQLVEKLHVVREPGRNPLFDTMFVLQNMDLREAMLVSQGMNLTNQHLYDWVLKPFAYEHHAAKFDFMLEAVERNGVISLKFDYKTSLLRKQTVELFAESYISLLDSFLSNPDALLHDVSCVTERQKSLLLDKFNKTASYYPAHLTLDRLFEEQTKKYGSRIAVRYGQESMTYSELNERASKLASLLKLRGTRRGDIVGIMTERSFDMLIGILGVLKAGAAYMPIDSNYPHLRIEYMLENSGVNTVVTQRRMADILRDFNSIELLLIDELPEVKGEISLPSSNHGPNDLAYVIYTSGTTGQPKGVMIEHHSVINRINWQQKKFPIREDDVILQKTTFTFDVSVWELFWWMFEGASILLLPPGAEKDPKQICQATKEHHVTVMHFVPSMLALFIEYLEHSKMSDYLESLRYIMVSGEELPRRQVERFITLPGLDAKLINLYGPTEATVDVTYYVCSDDAQVGPVPIGKPIDNTWMYILDDKLDLVPIGVPGDLWIAGVGLARGYLNNSELTSEKFIKCPYLEDTLMYRSGDVARWLPNGLIEYLGRSDHQIKVRGFRIEANEIVHYASTFPSVKEAYVQARGDQEKKYLCLYIVADQPVLEEELKVHLASVLPSYMIPDYVIQLDFIPLSSNGKADVKQLPDPVYSLQVAINKEVIEPSDAVEVDLLNIWKRILNKDNISINDDFFSIGGNSLLAIKMEIEIESIGYPVDNVGVFRYRSIRSLAQHLRSK